MSKPTFATKIIFSYLLIFCVCFVCRNAEGATYYVDKNNPNASDKNPGTKNLPWKTIQRAATVANAGDTVLIKAGVYYVGSSGQWSMPAVNPKNSGLPGQPIVFKVYPGDRVRIIGGGKTMAIGSYSRNYITWDGFIIGTKSGKWGGVMIFYSKGIVIQNCEIIGEYVPTKDNHDGIRVQRSEDIVIRNCLIHGIRGDHWNSAGIKFYFVKNAIVENCEIYDCYTGIFDKTDGINNIYRKNVFHDIGPGPSIFIFYVSHSIKIYQNIFYKTENIRIDAEFPRKHYNMEIYNNVFYGAGIDAARTYNLQIWNNIFYTNGFSIIARINGRPVYSNYNCFYPSAKFEVGRYTKNDKKYNSLTEWQRSEGFDLLSINQNPLFLDIDNHDFHLRNDSPCLKAGKDRQDYNDNGDSSESINMGAYIDRGDVIGPIATFNEK